MNHDILTEIVENIVVSADEVRKKEKKDAHDFGQLLAYAEALGIIKDLCDEETIKAVGLDFDIDAKYLL